MNPTMTTQRSKNCKRFPVLTAVLARLSLFLSLSVLFQTFILFLAILYRQKHNVLPCCQCVAV